MKTKFKIHDRFYIYRNNKVELKRVGKITITEHNVFYYHQTYFGQFYVLGENKLDDIFTEDMMFATFDDLIKHIENIPD